MQNLAVLGRACAVALVAVGCDSSRDALVLTSADPRNGIQGTLAGAGALIAFDSRFDGAVLDARISGEGGRVLWSYREEAVGSSLPKAPEIAVAGTTYSVFTSRADFEELQQVLSMQGSQGASALFGQRMADLEGNLRALAASAEGALIRQLALELVKRAPAPDLVRERRGLETAFQALQHAYPTGYPATTTVRTGDYYYSPEAGYIVLTQHELARFRHNHQLANPAHDGRGDLRSAGRSRSDDENQVGGCYGHCGAGCTNNFGGCTWGGWSHVYDGAPNLVGQVPLNCYCQGGNQQEICDLYEVYATNAWHTFTGEVAVGCIVHDACCRTVWGGCWDPICYAPMLEALADSCGPFTWGDSWTYYGPQNEVRYAGTISMGFCEAG
jgi:hypothetical protein